MLKLPLIDVLFELIGLNRYPQVKRPYQPSTGDGIARAEKRLADHRAQQAARLANAAPPTITRQQLRRAARA